MSEHQLESVHVRFSVFCELYSCVILREAVGFAAMTSRAKKAILLRSRTTFSNAALERKSARFVCKQGPQNRYYKAGCKCFCINIKNQERKENNHFITISVRNES
ncbi:hypothetical protein CDAR_64321 [Caerostris darwini]|uniref:Uncharacterized protein n=1 Tax=Caerostris darwini TaxID=1538125 RepID=A0AAV4RV82_9ARAC|nr:hypothetical protein CDAR_64321 [Caerostris darwini]